MFKWWKNLSETARIRSLIMLILFAGAVIPGVWALHFHGDWESFALNFSTEMAGALVTFILLDLIIRSREDQESERRQEENLKKDLIARLSSSVREITVSATDELRRAGWLEDGTLHKAQLRRANLERVDLSKADLNGANLHRAQLNQADLWNADLSDSDLSGAWLQEARLWQATLEDANMWQARLQGANLRSANLRGARLNETKLEHADLRDTDLGATNFEKARLDGVNLRGARFDPETILPDGSNWNDQIDVTIFTDPNHPAYWRKNGA